MCVSSLRRGHAHLICIIRVCPDLTTPGTLANPFHRRVEGRSSTSIVHSDRHSMKTTVDKHQTRAPGGLPPTKDARRRIGHGVCCFTTCPFGGVQALARPRHAETAGGQARPRHMGLKRVFVTILVPLHQVPPRGSPKPAPNVTTVLPLRWRRHGPRPLPKSPPYRSRNAFQSLAPSSVAISDFGVSFAKIHR